MTCSVCGGPIKSKRNTSGICHGTAECRKEAGRVANRKHYRAHPEKAAEDWAAYSPSYKERRAELDRQRLQDPDIRAKRRAAVQDFKTRPENAERVREYNQRGRRKYIARADRPCLSPDGCGLNAKVGTIYCPEHQVIESRRYQQRATLRKRRVLAERQGWGCPWCSQQLPQSLARAHVDHIIPRCSGLVIEEDWNFQLLHGRCNQQKSGTITPQAIALAAEHGLSLAFPTAENRFTAALRA